MRARGHAAAVLAVVATLAGCSGTGSRAGRSQPTAAAGAGNPAGTSTVPEAPGAVDRSPSGSPAAAPTAGPTTTATASRPRVTAQPAGQPAPATRVGALPGTYTYTLSGDNSSPTSPTTAPVDGTQTLVVDAPAGTDQHSDQSGGGEGIGLTLRYLASGVYLVDLKLSGQLSKEFRPSPPALATPLPASTGARWSTHMVSTDGSTTVDGSYQLTGTQTLVIGATSVPCIVLTDTQTIKGSFGGVPFTVTVNETRWESASYGLTVKDHSVTTIPGFGTSDTTAVLRSLSPA